MRKLFVLAVLLSMTTGCGRGWFPHLFRGAPCNGVSCMPAAHDCNGCPGYVAGDVSTGDYVDGGYIGSGAIGTYENVQPMTGIPGSALPGPITPK